MYEMTPTLREQLAALDTMSLAQLREKFLELWLAAQHPDEDY